MIGRRSWRCPTFLEPYFEGQPHADFEQGSGVHGDQGWLASMSSWSLQSCGRGQQVAQLKLQTVAAKNGVSGGCEVRAADHSELKGQRSRSQDCGTRRRERHAGGCLRGEGYKIWFESALQSCWLTGNVCGRQKAELWAMVGEARRLKVSR